MTVEPFPIIDVSGWDIIADETSGAEEKYWLEEPGTRVRWLYKPTKVKAGQVYGEDWAEKVVSELATMMGVPCARMELAQMRGTNGCIGADLCPRSHELHPGQVLLEQFGALGYVHVAKGKSHTGHSLENIHAGLKEVLPPRAASSRGTLRPSTSSPGI